MTWWTVLMVMKPPLFSINLRLVIEIKDSDTGVPITHKTERYSRDQNDCDNATLTKRHDKGARAEPYSRRSDQGEDNWIIRNA
jgi:hypothetical protein